MEMTMYNHYVERFYYWKDQAEKRGVMKRTKKSYLSYAYGYGRDALKLARELGIEEDIKLKDDLESIIYHKDLR